MSLLAAASFDQVAKDAAGFYEQLGVFAGALVVAVPVISFLASGPAQES